MLLGWDTNFIQISLSDVPEPKTPLQVAWKLKLGANSYAHLIQLEPEPRLAALMHTPKCFSFSLHSSAWHAAAPSPQFPIPARIWSEDAAHKVFPSLRPDFPKETQPQATTKCLREMLNPEMPAATAVEILHIAEVLSQGPALFPTAEMPHMCRRSEQCPPAA